MLNHGLLVIIKNALILKGWCFKRMVLLQNQIENWTRTWTELEPAAAFAGACQSARKVWEAKNFGEIWLWYLRKT